MNWLDFVLFMSDIYVCLLVTEVSSRIQCEGFIACYSKPQQDSLSDVTHKRAHTLTTYGVALASYGFRGFSV